MNYKKHFKADTIKKIDNELTSIPEPSLQMSELPLKTKKSKPTFLKVTIAVSSVVLASLTLVIAVPALVIILSGIKTVSSFRPYSAVYQVPQNDDTFVPLNEVYYPSLDKKSISVSEEYSLAVNNFANDIYQNLNHQEDNISFSPFGLYSNLSIVSLASTDETIEQQFNTLLYLDETLRKEQYSNAYLNDYYQNEDGTTQLYNGVFQSEAHGTINPVFINLLANYYCEAFSIDFENSSDVNKMIDWANQKIGEENFLSPSDLSIDENSALYLLTTLYFNNKWETKFVKNESYKDNFYVTPLEPIEVTYMTHKYYGDYYDYGDYYSFYDYYKNNMKVKYLVCKSNADDIFELTDETNIFTDDINVLHKDQVIKNSVPKFSSSSLVDFSSALCQLGYESLFDDSINSLGNIYTDEVDPIFISECKQKNKVSFNEDGTTIKSVTWTGFGAGSAGPMPDGIEVQLNQPFIYIIYDENDLPLYVGNVVNPSL